MDKSASGSKAASTRAPAQTSYVPAGRLDPRRLLLLFGGLVVLVIVGLAAAFVWHLRTTTIANAKRDLTNLAAVLAEQTARTFQSADLILDAIGQQIAALNAAGRADKRALYQMFREKIAGAPQIKQVTFVSPDGRVVASSREYPSPDLYLGDREWFSALRNSIRTSDLIAKPLRTRVGGDWIVLVSRRIVRADGSFAGILNIGLDPHYFESVYRAATAMDGMAITLLRNDGTVLARYPDSETAIGKFFGDSPLFRDQQWKTNAVLDMAGTLDKTRRFYAPRVVTGYPLIVNPSIARAVVLASWRREATLVGSVAGASVVGIIILLLFLRRLFVQVEATDAALRISEERARSQAALLQDAVDALADGFVLYDAEDRFVMCNQRFRELRALNPASRAKRLRSSNTWLGTACVRNRAIRCRSRPRLEASFWPGQNARGPACSSWVPTRRAGCDS